MTALLIAVVLVAALACPAMMWWSERRGRSAQCCPSRRSSEERPASLEELRAEQQRLDALIANAEIRNQNGDLPELKH